MDITSYFYWRLKLQQHRLTYEDFSGSDTETSDLGLLQVNLLAGFASSHFQQLLDNLFNVNIVIHSSLYSQRNGFFLLKSLRRNLFLLKSETFDQSSNKKDKMRLLKIYTEQSLKILNNSRNLYLINRFHYHPTRLFSIQKPEQNPSFQNSETNPNKQFSQNLFLKEDTIMGNHANPQNSKNSENATEPKLTPDEVINEKNKRVIHREFFNDVVGISLKLISFLWSTAK